MGAPPAPKDLRAELLRHFAVLTRATQEGQLPIDIFRGEHIKLAWGFLKAGDPAMGMTMLTGVPQDFYLEDLPRLAAEDPRLAEAADYVAGFLLSNGHGARGREGIGG